MQSKWTGCCLILCFSLHDNMPFQWTMRRKQYLTCLLLSSINFYDKWHLPPSEENKCWCKAKPNTESNGDQYTVEILSRTFGILATASWQPKFIETSYSPLQSLPLTTLIRWILGKRGQGCKTCQRPRRLKSSKFILVYNRFSYCQIKLA